MNRLQEIKEEIAKNKGYANWYCLLNGFRYHSDFSIDEVEKFENKAAEIYAEEFKPKWISVDERLPEDGMEVLVFGENYFDVPIQAFLYMGYWKGSLEVTDQMNDCYRVDPFLTSQKHITHWMPLPEKP